MPLIRENEDAIKTIEEEIVDSSKTDWDSFETSWDFQHHPLLRKVHTIAEAFTQWQAECDDRFNQLKANEEELNRIFIDIYGLKDELTRQRLNKRLRKAQLGNLGDVEPVGEGVFEMREHFGPGWRMYYVQRGEVLIVMLGGGDKSTQQADIRRAAMLAKRLED